MSVDESELGKVEAGEGRGNHVLTMLGHHAPDVSEQRPPIRRQLAHAILSTQLAIAEIEPIGHLQLLLRRDRRRDDAQHKGTMRKPSGTRAENNSALVI